MEKSRDTFDGLCYALNMNGRNLGVLLFNQFYLGVILKPWYMILSKYFIKTNPGKLLWANLWNIMNAEMLRMENISQSMMVLQSDFFSQKC
ncbi:hypothetical protein GOP47_0001997 [Adiantum capillus-veneris]|uniref:Uncharacterized protein n=1 Tax=Adiantum capillus-veneris TaxID=13818 RepID=A0A9D4ZNS8_ADICA|nr:hypothetical protein GOP47_0001997 [Adiantum capillus-veneris]